MADSLGRGREQPGHWFGYFWPPLFLHPVISPIGQEDTFSCTSKKPPLHGHPRLLTLLPPRPLGRRRSLKLLGASTTASGHLCTYRCQQGVASGAPKDACSFPSLSTWQPWIPACCYLPFTGCSHLTLCSVQLPFLASPLPHPPRTGAGQRQKGCPGTVS